MIRISGRAERSSAASYPERLKRSFAPLYVIVPFAQSAMRGCR
jgi:hypothetical protein